MGLGEVFGGIEGLQGVGSKLISYTIWGAIGFVVLIVFGVIIWWARKRKKWNLRVEVKMPRSDGKIIYSEKAKGHYNVVEGIVSIKRKKLPAVGMKPFDVRNYLQGLNFLEVIQVGPNEFIPIHPKSFNTLHDFKDGKKYALLDIEADLSKRKVWKNYYERSCAKRYTLLGWLDRHWRAMELGIIIFIILLGMSILWMRMPTICG